MNVSAFSTKITYGITKRKAMRKVLVGLKSMVIIVYIRAALTDPPVARSLAQIVKHLDEAIEEVDAKLQEYLKRGKQ